MVPVVVEQLCKSIKRGVERPWAEDVDQKKLAFLNFPMSNVTSMAGGAIKPGFKDRVWAWKTCLEKIFEWNLKDLSFLSIVKEAVAELGSHSFSSAKREVLFSFVNLTVNK